MPQYRLAASVKADQLEAQSTSFSQVVKQYIQRADNYVLAVVLFAASLFFAGISTRMHERSACLAILAIGYVLFLGTVIWIATFPVSLSV